MRQFNNAWHIVRMLAMIPITMKTVTYSVSFANNDSFRAPLTWEEALISPSLQMRKLRLRVGKYLPINDLTETWTQVWLFPLELYKFNDSSG